jgi:DTW domain-containing protein YfiP
MNSPENPPHSPSASASASASAPLQASPASQCPRCLKPEPDFCVCRLIEPKSNRLRVVILQHPQEPDHLLGTARLAHLALKNSDLRVGLSWANLAHALGNPASSPDPKNRPDPQRWGVLYLGSGIQNPPETPNRHPLSYPVVQWVNEKGLPLAGMSPGEMEGIIVLDGTWSQAKALWWRNPWLLKLRRLVLTPRKKSLYGARRKEPRRECLSTIETIAECLTGFNEPESIQAHLETLFSALLNQSEGSAREGDQAKRTNRRNDRRNDQRKTKRQR